MDTDTQTKEEKELDAALENVPDEVQDFMWSDAFTIILDAMQKTVGVDDKQKAKIRSECYDILVGLKTMTEVAEELLKEMSPELVAKILYIIDSEIITRAENITEYYTEEIEDSDASEESTKTVSNAFSVLNQSLTTPTNLTPTKREYTSKPTSPVEPATPVAADPYREIPDTK